MYSVFLPDLIRLLAEGLHDLLLGLIGDSALTDEERAAIEELQDSRQMLPDAFDSGGAEAHSMLLEIWNTAFPADARERFEDGDYWRDLGFQSSRSCTDIRAGRLGLDQLCYLSGRYPERLRQLADEARTLGYPFACSCFNVTQMLVGFFDLSQRPIMNPVPGATKAGASQIARFARFCNHAGSTGGARMALDELYCALVQRLHETWRDMTVSAVVTLMDFPKALKEVHGVNAEFWRYRHQQLTDLQALKVISRSSDSHGMQDRERDRASLRGSYQPPVLPEAQRLQSYSKPCRNADPIAKPLVDVDLDSIFAELGLLDADSTCESTALPYDATAETSNTSDDDFNAFLDRCLSVSNQVNAKA